MMNLRDATDFAKVEAAIRVAPANLTLLEQVRMPGSQTVKLSLPLLLEADASIETCARMTKPIMEFVAKDVKEITHRKSDVRCCMLTFRDSVLQSMAGCVPRGRAAAKGKRLVVITFPTVYVDLVGLHLVAEMCHRSLNVPLWTAAMCMGILQPLPHIATTRHEFKWRQRGESVLKDRQIAFGKAQELSCLLVDSTSNTTSSGANSDVHLEGRLSMDDAIKIRRTVLQARPISIVSTGWQNINQLSDDARQALDDWMCTTELLQDVAVTRYMASVSPSSGYMSSIAFQLDKSVCMNVEGFYHKDKTVMRVDRTGAWFTCESSSMGREWPANAAKALKCSDCKKNQQRARLPSIQEDLLAVGIWLNVTGLVQLPVHVLVLLGLRAAAAPVTYVAQRTISSLTPSMESRNDDEQTSAASLMQQVSAGRMLTEAQIATMQSLNRAHYARVLSVSMSESPIARKLVKGDEAPEQSWFVETNRVLRPCNDVNTLMGMTDGAVAQAATPVPQIATPPALALASTSRMSSIRRRLLGLPRSPDGPASPITRNTEVAVSPVAKRKRGSGNDDIEKDLIVRFGHPLIDFTTSHTSALVLSAALVHPPHWVAATAQ